MPSHPFPPHLGRLLALHIQLAGQLGRGFVGSLQAGLEQAGRTERGAGSWAMRGIAHPDPSQDKQQQRWGSAAALAPPRPRPSTHLGGRNLLLQLRGARLGGVALLLRGRQAGLQLLHLRLGVGAEDGKLAAQRLQLDGGGAERGLQRLDALVQLRRLPGRERRRMLRPWVQALGLA